MDRLRMVTETLLLPPSGWGAAVEAARDLGPVGRRIREAHRFLTRVRIPDDHPLVQEIRNDLLYRLALVR